MKYTINSHTNAVSPLYYSLHFTAKETEVKKLRLSAASFTAILSMSIR